MMNRPEISGVPLRAGWVTYPPFSRRGLSLPAFSLPAFSLIEVLIAVVVLAIGLLGLGMVFPVVVRQQRGAQDSILGFSAAESAAAQLLQRGDGRDCEQSLNFNTITRFPVIVDITWKNPLPTWQQPNDNRDGIAKGVVIESIETAPAVIQAALERDATNLDSKGRPRTVFGVGNVRVRRGSSDANDKAILVSFSGDLAQRDVEPLAVAVSPLDVSNAGKQILVKYVTNLPGNKHSVTGLTGALWERAISVGYEVKNNERVVKTSWFDPKIDNGVSISPLIVGSTLAGTMTVGDGTAKGMDIVTLSPVERLSPSPFVGTPQFVSDFWVRRSGETQMQVAVFARRIDAGIRVPSGDGTTTNWTLSNVLSGTPSKFPPSAVRAPVAEDSVGRPTLTGADETGKARYSLFRLVQLKKFPPAVKVPSAYLDLADGFATKEPVAMQALRQPGQKLVDQFGGVNTVVRLDETLTNGQVRLILEAAISRDLFDQLSTVPGTGGGVTQSTQFVLYTPQVPAGVRVVTLERP